MDYRAQKCQNKECKKCYNSNLKYKSLVSKFDEVKVIGQRIFDILIINKVELDVSFSINQFYINGFSAQNQNGSGITIYVREDITNKILTKRRFPDDIEALFIEINFRKCKWLLCGLYQPSSQSDQYFFDNLDEALDVYSTYEKNYFW